MAQPNGGHYIFLWWKWCQWNFEGFQMTEEKILVYELSEYIKTGNFGKSLLNKEAIKKILMPIIAYKLCCS